MAEIGIIIGVYNAGELLPRCLESVMRQTFTDYEVILVDDGSCDSSGRICDDYVGKDSRFHVIHQENGGPSASRNTGLDWVFRESDCRWISFIDDDDYVHPFYLEALLGAARKWKTDIAVSGYVRTEGEALPEVKQWTSHKYRTDRYYPEHTLMGAVPWGKIIRKSLLKNYRFPPGKIHEDEYLMYRVLFMREYLAVVQQDLYAYYKNVHGIMLSKWSMKRLDGLGAMEQQTRYFLRRGMPQIARSRFWYLVQHIVYDQLLVLECDELSEREKREEIRHLKKKLRYLLTHPRKYVFLPALHYFRLVRLYTAAELQLRRCLCSRKAAEAVGKGKKKPSEIVKKYLRDW